MRYILSCLLLAGSAFGQCGLLRFNPVTFNLDCTGPVAPILAGPNAWTGTQDFSAATLVAPSVFLRSDTGWTMTNGQKVTFGLSATTAGPRLTAGTLPSTQVGGDLFMNASGILGWNDGTNANAALTFLGSGAAFGTPPTAGHHMLWGTNYQPTTTGSAIWGVANGGTGVATLTGLAKGNGTSAFSQATAADLSSANYVAGGGTAQAQTATYSPAVAALANGLYLCWLPLAANSAAAPTFAPNGLTAKPVTKLGTTALVANDITTTAVACAVYDGTEWQLQNPQVAAAGMTVPGSGTELQVRSSGTALAALANSSIPNAGEVSITTAPTASATRAVFGLGAIPAAGLAGANQGTYYHAGAATGFVGDYFHAELNGVQKFAMKQSAGFTELFFGPPTSAGHKFLAIDSGGFEMRRGDDNRSVDFKTGSVTAQSPAANAQFTADGNVSPNNISLYNAIATVGNGVPAIYATVDLTAQSAAKTSTLLYTPTVTGMYRVSYYAKVTTAGTTSILGGTTGLVLTFTDGTDSVAQTAFTLPEDDQNGSALSIATGNTTNTTQAISHGSAVIWAKTAVAINYAFGYTSTGTAMQYELHIKIEAL